MSAKRSGAAVLAALVAVLLGATPVHAFDEVLHRYLVYAIARDNGFSPDDAGVIADASWSLDVNDTTTAFDWGLIGKEAASLATSGATLSELPHMRSGQVFHALTTEANRRTVEGGFLYRLRQRSPDLSSSDSSRRREALILLGQYLHFAGDLVVHPQDPFLGHGLSGHGPDRADLTPDKMQIAMALLNRQLQQARAGRVEAIPKENLERFPSRLDPDDGRDRRLRAVAGAVVNSWSRPRIREGDVQTSGIFGEAYFDLLEQQRNVEAGAAVGAAIGERVPPFKKMVLDENGEEVQRNRAARGIDDLPFATTLLDRSEFRQEREENTAVQVLRAIPKAARAVSPAAGLSAELIGAMASVGDSTRRTAAWVPPSSPGGVALNPRLKISGSVGTPTRIAFDRDTLVLETSTGRYPFEGVSTRSFATVARAVAAGQVPFITIGSEASNRNGYARVTYSPALRDTAEGEALYQADIQFKAIFLGLPLGTGYALNTATEPLAGGYPGPGGEYVRLWITSSGIELALRNGRLAAARHGMRILSETRLQADVRDDPEMDAYTDRLTENWDAIAGRILAFRTVEMLARTTAIAFWAHDRQVPVDPMILLMPPRTGLTPEYAPIVAKVSSAGLSASGGVALTPEDKRNTPGRMFLNQIAGLFATNEETSGIPFAGRLVAAGIGFLNIALAVAVPALLMWGVAALALGRAAQIPLFALLRLWVILYAAYQATLIVTSPLYRNDWLSYFDQDLIAMAMTLGLAPTLLFALLKRDGRLLALASALQQRAGLRAAAVAIGVLTTVSAATFSVGVSFAMVAITGPVPTPLVNTVLTYGLLPVDTLSQAVMVGTTGSGGAPEINPIPRSLLTTFRSPYEHRRYAPEAEPVIRSGGTPSDMFPFEELQRIDRWPPGATPPDGSSYYSVDGKSPL